MLLRPVLAGIEIRLMRFIEDESEEEDSSAPSSPPAPVLRRGKFDDEEEEDVCLPAGFEPPTQIDEHRS